MRYPMFFIMLFLFSTIALGQSQVDSVYKQYMPLKMYKSNFKKPLTSLDSLNFKFNGKDTLVLLKNNFRPKGVGVDYEYKDSTFLYYYEKVVFNKKDDTLKNRNSMKYWKDDIRIFFSESVSRKTKKSFMSFAKKVDTAVDSLKITEVNSVEASNYVVYYFGDYDYEVKMTSNKYGDGYSWWTHNQLYRYSMKIDPEVYFNEQLMQSRMRQYFIKSLGYFFMTDDLDCKSYFSNCESVDKQLTELDMELLKYHYSYGICKGTNLAIFEDQHKKAKEILQKTGHNIKFFHTEDLKY